MSASQAPHATPRRSLDTGIKKPVADKGWLSRATFESLPLRFQEAAKILQERGELLIGESL